MARIDALLAALDDRARRLPGLLRGYPAIAAYCRMPAASLARYRRTMGFPVIKFGRQCVSSPALIDAWLIALERARRHAQRQQTTMSPETLGPLAQSLPPAGPPMTEAQRAERLARFGPTGRRYAAGRADGTRAERAARTRPPRGASGPPAAGAR